MKNMNEVPKPVEEEPKEKELTENLIISKYNNRKNNFKNDYIKYINDLHSKRLSLQNKEVGVTKFFSRPKSFA